MSDSPRRRVVITGMGVISPLGNSHDQLWDALISGRSGVGPMETIPAHGLPVQCAAEAREFTGHIDNFGPLEKSQKKNIRLLTFPVGSNGEGVAGFIASHGRVPEARLVRSVYGGLLAQKPCEPPSYESVDLSWKIVSERHPTEVEMDDLCFAWASIFAVKSNAILIARDGAVIGIGAGLSLIHI